MSYTIYDHIHIYAAWAASRAASAGRKNRFKVEVGQKILSASALKAFVRNPDKLPATAVEFDAHHKIWREQIISLSHDHANNAFTHGIAAKLINVYLKSIIICGGHHDHEAAKYVHPPVDSLILTSLADNNFANNAGFWRMANRVAWSNFDSDMYQKVIDHFRIGLGDSPLWTIEENWRGFR